MKWYWLDVPEPRPTYGALFFCGEALAGFLSFAIHLGQNSGVQVALVEGNFAAPNHGGHNSWKCFQAADRTDGVFVFLCDGADFECQLGGGSQSVTRAFMGVEPE